MIAASGSRHGIIVAVDDSSNLIPFKVESGNGFQWDDTNGAPSGFVAGKTLTSLRFANFDKDYTNALMFAVGYTE
jgi:hypothetical protein